MSLLNAARTPPTVGSPDMTVDQACRRMIVDRVAAIGVVENGKLIGLFTERDLTKKVIPNGLRPETTLLRDVMTSPCKTTTLDKTFNEAINYMLEEDIRHLPIVDDESRILGMLSLRSMLIWRIEDLDNALKSAAAYMGADGIGG